MDAGKQPDVCPKHPCQFARAFFTGGAVLIAEQIQRALDVHVFAIDSKFQRRDGFVKQFVPCGGTDDRLIVQKFFHLIRQLVRLHRPHTIKDRFVARKVGVGGQKPIHMGVVHAVEFQTVKDQRSGVGGNFVLHVGHKFAALWIGCVLVIAQAREGHDATRDDVDLFKSFHSVEQFFRVQIGQFPFVISGKTATGIFQPIHVALEFFGVGRWV